MLFSERSYPTKVFLTASVCAVAGFGLLSWLPFSHFSALTFVAGVLAGAAVAVVHYIQLASNTSVQKSDAVKVLYVGNLPYRANEAIVQQLFSRFGHVLSVRLMKDKVTGKRRGFGFIEMYAADAEKARATLNDTEFQQRTLKVRDANEKKLVADL